MKKQIQSIGLFMLTMFLSAPIGAQEALSVTPPQDFKIDESGELKIFTDLTIPEGEIRTGAIRVIGGKLTVAGLVTGKITVIGGDVDILSTATVEGTIVALGGTITKDPEANITGEVLEINSGTISLSRKKTKEMFDDEGDLSEEELSSRWYEDEDFADSGNNNFRRKFGDDENRSSHEIYEDRNRWTKRGYYNHRVRSDMGIDNDVVVRYNRAEGAAIYIPFSPDTDDIPGFHVKAAGGYAFGPQNFYGRLAIGQYLFNNRLGLIAEGYSEPRNDDDWRISSGENFLAALLIHEDWYDWYEAEGYGASVVAYPLSWLSLGVRYRNEVNRFMKTTVSWSVFGNDKTFRPGYGITEGADVNLQYHARIGDPIGLFHRRFKASFGGTLSRSVSGSKFHYTKQDIVAEVFFPFQYRLGVRAVGRTGAVLSTGQNADLGYQQQHLTPIGGIGSIAGYGYKDRTGSHYAVLNVDFALKSHGDILALLWQYGTAWDAEDNLFAGDYIANVQSSGRHSIGIRFGDEDSRIEIYKPLSGGGGYTVHFRVVDL